MFELNKNNSKKADKNDVKKLASIVCGYDSYKLGGAADKTIPKTYETITEIIGCGELNFKEIPICNELRKGGNQEDFASSINKILRLKTCSN